MSLREVAQKTIEVSPDDRKGQISYSYLVNIEKGKTTATPEAILSLSKIYDEPYEFMMYKASYRSTNPFSESKDNMDTKRNNYLDNLTVLHKTRFLSDEEKRSAEKLLATFIKSVTGGR